MAPHEADNSFHVHHLVWADLTFVPPLGERPETLDGSDRKDGWTLGLLSHASLRLMI